MDRVVQETEELVGKLKDETIVPDSPERIMLQERLIYLREHWPKLRTEFDAIRAEHKGPVEKKAPPSPKRASRARK